MPPADAAVADTARADATLADAPHATADARPDAPPPDAAVPPPIVVSISVMGPGSVTLVGSGICTKQCTLFATYGALATLEAAANDTKTEFAGWTGAACLGQPAICTFLAVAPVTVSAKFVKAD